jgi:DNA-binding NarL/FixJ family response regulator
VNTIVLIEDHAMMRKGLSDFLTETGRWQVLGAAATLDAAKALLSKPEVRPDIILLDINLEDASGRDSLPWLREQSTGCDQKLTCSEKIVVYSAFDDYAHVQAALKMGVQGYVCKAQSEAELEAALFAVLNGDIALDEKLRTKISIVTKLTDRLTQREQQVFIRVRQGASNKDIARQMNISIRTVENHIYCICGKTGLTRAMIQAM